VVDAPDILDLASAFFKRRSTPEPTVMERLRAIELEDEPVDAVV